VTKAAAHHAMPVTRYQGREWPCRMAAQSIVDFVKQSQNTGPAFALGRSFVSTAVPVARSQEQPRPEGERNESGAARHNQRESRFHKTGSRVTLLPYYPGSGGQLGNVS